jgi:hypothetical protein
MIKSGHVSQDGETISLFTIYQKVLNITASEDRGNEAEAMDSAAELSEIINKYEKLSNIKGAMVSYQPSPTGKLLTIPAEALVSRWKKVREFLERFREIHSTDNKFKAAKSRLSTLGGFKTIIQSSLPSVRVAIRSYPIAPSDLVFVFNGGFLADLALATEKAMTTRIPRSSDVRAYLRHELESCFELMSNHNINKYNVSQNLDNVFIPVLDDTVLMEDLANLIEGQQFAGSAEIPSSSELDKALSKFMKQLPGHLQGDSTATDRLEIHNPLIVLSWAIAIDAGLLNRQIRKDMKRIIGPEGFACPADPDTLFFYQPHPTPEADLAFREYVKARWPIVTFALDPVAEQQNIADALSRRRDLQLAVAFAFSTGRINFNQLNKFRRQLDYEAATIALNRTVTAFAQGNETFGWRFAPRFQTPPEEKTNLHVALNLLYRNGPGRDYQIKNSKLEAGQRELTAVVILPSFLQRIRVETTGNWYRLHDPDEITLKTPHMLAQSRKIMELRRAVETACDAQEYRPDDLQRLRTRVRQVESMLPMQTLMVDIPYGNSLSGFDLFARGSTSLAPELVGYQGIDVISNPRDGENSLLLFGKNFAIQETKVVAGGQRVEEKDVELLSREILRVKLPKNLETTQTHEGKNCVEVHLATPNGISNRLLVPLDRAEETASASHAVPGYTLLDERLTVAARLVATGPSTYKAEPLPVAQGSKIRIVPHEEPMDKTATVSVTLRFAVDNEVVKVDLNNIPYDDKSTKSYLIGPDSLFIFARDFIKKLDAYGKLDPPKGLTELTSKSIEVTVQPSSANVSPKTTTNQLRVDIEMYLPDRKKPPPQAKDEKPKEQKTGTQPENPPSSTENAKEKSEAPKPKEAASAEEKTTSPAREASKPSGGPPQSEDQSSKTSETPKAQGGRNAPDTKKTSDPQKNETPKNEQGVFRGGPIPPRRPGITGDPMVKRAEAALPPLSVPEPAAIVDMSSRAANPGQEAPAARGASAPPTRAPGKKSRDSLLRRLFHWDRADADPQVRR